MSDRKHFVVGILTGRMTALFALSIVLAVSILFNQFMVTAGVNDFNFPFKVARRS